MFSFSYKTRIPVYCSLFGDILSNLNVIKKAIGPREIHSCSVPCNLWMNKLYFNNRNNDNCLNQLFVQSKSIYLLNQNFQIKDEISDGGKYFEDNNSSEFTHYNNEKAFQDDLLCRQIMKNKPLPVNEWDKLIRIVLDSGTQINNINIDTSVIQFCIKLNAFYSGKSYFAYMDATSKKLNLAFVGNYMRLCYSCREQCSNQDINAIEMLYNEYILKYPILDANSAENVILGLSITKLWTDYKKYLDMILESCSPRIKCYCAIIEAAFLNKEYDIGWKILQEMADCGKNPTDEVFDIWLDISKKEKSMLFLEKVLNYLAYYGIKPSKKIASRVKQEYEHINKPKAKGVFTSVTNRGVCKNCYQKLEGANISITQFDELKKAFLDPVLIGKNIFIKTRPEELVSYQKTLETTAPYDVVLDGLNIAYSSGTKNKTASNYSFMVKSVVAHFVNQSKKVLVLGRKHMNQWPKKNMEFIEENATLFLAEDLSQDDPFLLYAALYSGPQTDFVSRDLMRGHKFLLKDQTLQSVFMKWQNQHQIFVLYIQNDGRVFLKMPPPYNQNAHKNHEGLWHIPYEDEKPEQMGGTKFKSFKTNTDNQYWLCLR